MRRIAKLTLLLAPLMMASMSGCATPSWMSSSEAKDPRESRLNRLLAVAAEYEEEGKPDAAMRVYEHVIAQQPDNTYAQTRRDTLAQQGVSSGGRSLKRELGPAGLGQRSTMLAATPRPAMPKPGKMQSATDVAEEIHRKNAELNQMLAERKAQPQPVMAVPTDWNQLDNGLIPTPATPESLIADKKIQVRDLIQESDRDSAAGWTSTTTSTGWQTASATPLDIKSTDEFASKPAVESSKPNDSLFAKADAEKLAKPNSDPASADSKIEDGSGWVVATEPLVASKEKKDNFGVVVDQGAGQSEVASKAEIASKSEAVTENQAKVESSDWTVATSPEAKSESNVVQTSLTPAKKSADHWMTTDLTRAVATSPTKSDVETESKSVTVEEKWESTNLVRLCEGLPEEYIPAVQKLESQDPAERVAGLIELGEYRSEAKAASIAVYGLLEDSSPIVAVYAAGTLRQLTGDAWSSVHTLSKYLEHSDPAIAQLSAYLLGQMGPEAMDAVPALEKLRQGSEGLTKLHAAEALTHIAPDDASSVKTLTAALKDENRELRWFAAVSLGTIAGECEKQAAEALKLALKDSEAEVRIAACLSLGGLGNQASIAIPELENAVRSDSPEVKTAAETALACLRS